MFAWLVVLSGALDLLPVVELAVLEFELAVLEFEFSGSSSKSIFLDDHGELKNSKVPFSTIVKILVERSEVFFLANGIEAIVFGVGV